MIQDGAVTINSRTIDRRCNCFGGRRKLPMRIHEETAKLVRQRAGAAVTLPPLRDEVLLNYRCPSCKGIVELTVGDVLGVGG